MDSFDHSRPLLSDFHSASPDSPIEDATIISPYGLEGGEDGSETLELRPSRGVIERLLMAVRRRHVRLNKDERSARTRFSVEEKRRRKWKDWKVRRCGIRMVIGLPLLVVFFFGIVHIVNVSMGLVNLIKDDKTTYSRDWLPLEQYQKGDYTGLTRNVKPIHCHSHNDYWRRVPLFEALRWGCTGVEADVWLYSNDLFVGHSTRDLTKSHTFRSMYIDPLTAILDQRNAPNHPFEDATAVSNTTTAKAGVFELDPAQTLVLLVDFKNDGHALFPVVSAHLGPLREKGYLTYYNGRVLIPGPITVVATGNAPFDLITAPSTVHHRDIFFDAPLSALTQSTSPQGSAQGQGQGTIGTTPTSTFDLTNSYYASTPFTRTIGFPYLGRLTRAQRATIRAQIRGARERGLKSRYWGAPAWPVGLRNHVWRVLVEEGVGFLNGDDLRGMTSLDWEVRTHGGWMG